MWTQLDYRTMDEQATDEALELLAKAEYFRLNGKPEKWARDVERKALKKLERSFELREGLFSNLAFPLPECVAAVLPQLRSKAETDQGVSGLARSPGPC